MFVNINFDREDAAGSSHAPAGPRASDDDAARLLFAIRYFGRTNWARMSSASAASFVSRSAYVAGVAGGLRRAARSVGVGRLGVGRRACDAFLSAFSDRDLCLMDRMSFARLPEAFARAYPRVADAWRIGEPGYAFDPARPRNSHAESVERPVNELYRSVLTMLHNARALGDGLPDYGRRLKKAGHGGKAGEARRALARFERFADGDNDDATYAVLASMGAHLALFVAPPVRFTPRAVLATLRDEYARWMGLDQHNTGDATVDADGVLDEDNEDEEEHDDGEDHDDEDDGEEERDEDDDDEDDDDEDDDDDAETDEDDAIVDSMLVDSEDEEESNADDDDDEWTDEMVEHVAHTRKRPRTRASGAPLARAKHARVR